MRATAIEDFHQIHGGESERQAAEKVPGKLEEEFDRMTHDMTPTGVVGVEMENMDKSGHPKTYERSEFQTGKTQRRREKTSGRRWRQNGVNIVGEREGTTKWVENGLGFRGKRVAYDKKERRKWGVNTLSVWGKRNDRGKREGDDGRQADDTSNERRPEADVSKPEVATSAANDRGSDGRRRRRSVGDIDEDSDPSVDCYPAAVSYLSKRSKPRRRSVPAPYDGPKRNWETNTMKVWGKRNGAKPTWEEYLYSAEPISGKRKWTSNNAFRIWGKRDAMPPPSDEENFFSRLYDIVES